MNPDEIITLLKEIQEAQSNGLTLSMQTYMILGAIVFIIGCIIAYIGGYLQKRGENYAAKQDFAELLRQISETTKATKKIEEEIQQQFRFIESQVQEFYSPLVSKIKQIRVLSEIRVEVSKNSDEAWKELCERLNPIPLDWDSEKAWEPYKAILDYDNNQFREVILPLYDDMLSIFTKNYGLAEETTKKYYPEFCRFVEIWHRFQAESLPRDVLIKLNLEEAPLHKFYEDLEKQLQNLTLILSNKKE